MKSVIKNVIIAGGYKLAEIQYKIKKLYTMGDLTEADMNELITLASVGVSTDAERPETLQIVQALGERIATLEERMKALEGKTDVPDTDYPVWKPWDGISKDYQTGAIVSHNGQLWQSAYQGQNVWEPGTIGTENMWKHPDISTNDIL